MSEQEVQVPSSPSLSFFIPEFWDFKRLLAWNEAIEGAPDCGKPHIRRRLGASRAVA